MFFKLRFNSSSCSLNQGLTPFMFFKLRINSFSSSLAQGLTPSYSCSLNQASTPLYIFFKSRFNPPYVL